MTKTIVAILLALSLSLGAQEATVQAELPALPNGGVITQTDFQRVLVGHVWTWPMETGGGTDIRFSANGFVRNTNGWTAKYQITGVNEVTLRLGKRTAKLVFDRSNFASYDATDFDKVRTFTGTVKKVTQR